MTKIKYLLSAAAFCLLACSIQAKPIDSKNLDTLPQRVKNNMVYKYKFGTDSGHLEAEAVTGEMLKRHIAQAKERIRKGEPARIWDLEETGVVDKSFKEKIGHFQNYS